MSGLKFLVATEKKGIYLIEKAKCVKLLDTVDNNPNLKSTYLTEELILAQGSHKQLNAIFATKSLDLDSLQKHEFIEKKFSIGSPIKNIHKISKDEIIIQCLRHLYKLKNNELTEIKVENYEGIPVIFFHYPRCKIQFLLEMIL